ncbi:hypothetical protein SMICM304S_06025 [Streptomyces microflavus]
MGTPCSVAEVGPRERSPRKGESGGSRVNRQGVAEQLARQPVDRHPTCRHRTPPTARVLSGDETSSASGGRSHRSCAQLLTWPKRGRIIRLPRERSLLPVGAAPAPHLRPRTYDTSRRPGHVCCPRQTLCAAPDGRTPPMARPRLRAGDRAGRGPARSGSGRPGPGRPRPALPGAARRPPPARRTAARPRATRSTGTAGRAGPAPSPTRSGYGSTSAPRPPSAGSSSPGRPRTRRATASSSPPTAPTGRPRTAPPPARAGTRRSPSPARPATYA